jgi:hypothetical protein
MPERMMETAVMKPNETEFTESSCTRRAPNPARAHVIPPDHDLHTLADMASTMVRVPARCMHTIGSTHTRSGPRVKTSRSK